MQSRSGPAASRTPSRAVHLAWRNRVTLFPGEPAVERPKTFELLRKPLSVELSHELVRYCNAMEGDRFPRVPVVSIIESVFEFDGVGPVGYVTCDGGGASPPVE